MFFKSNFITFSLYFIITAVITTLVNEPSHVIFVWPAVGIGIVAALVWGYKVLPALYLAQLSILFFLYNGNIYSFEGFITTHAYILTGLFRSYFGAFLIKYFIGYPNSLTSYKSILKLFLIIAPLITFISSLAFNFVKYFVGALSPKFFYLDFFSFWTGDFLGFIIFVPFTMIFISQPKSIWRPRLLTVGLPMIFIFLSVVFIYNKTLDNENTRFYENIKIKSDMLAAKINQHYFWIERFKGYATNHLENKLNDRNKLSTYLNNKYKLLDALVWVDSNNINQISSSDNLKEAKYIKLKNYNFNQLNTTTLTDENLSETLYIKELGEFVTIISLRKENTLKKVFMIYNLSHYLRQLVKTYNLHDINIALNLGHNREVVNLISLPTLLPRNLIIAKSRLSINNENWIISLTPTTDYFRNYQSNLNLVAILGFVFTGLIGAMLLVITGRILLTDIHVKERTLELDFKANEFRDQKKQYQTLIEQHPVILWRQEIDNQKMAYISDKVEALFGYEMDKWINVKNFWVNHIHPDDQQRVKQIIKNSLVDNSPFELEYKFIKADSSIIWVKDVVNIIHNNQHQIQLVGLMIDVTETQIAKEGQSISESKYRTLFKHAVDPLIIINLDDHTFKDSNDKAISLLGIKNINDYMTLASYSPTHQPDGSNSKKRLLKIYNKVKQNNSFNFEWNMINHENQEITCRIELIKLPEKNSNIILANINDITEIKLHERKINQLAYYDNLTKLPNREYFYSKFEYFHGLAVEKEMYGTIIYLDLDRFKLLNDSLGHQAGDELLKMVAQRVRKVSKKNDFCARLGGDEFVILTKKFKKTIESTLETSLVKSELILEALNEPYQLGDYEHFITPSIGISVFPSADTTTDQIIHQADIAMYASKEKGKNTITIYQAKMIKLVSERLKIEKAIRQAFDKGEFQLHYQPQMNIKNEIISAEALLRWNKSESLHINTEDLIDTIEQIGLTHELGYWVFDQACSQLEKWRNQGHSIKSIAVNVSAKQFHQNLFADQIKSIIESYNIKPSQMILELTEAVIIEDLSNLVDKLNELKEYGVRISLDDFGTGYSSLAYLKDLPIDQLKIDKLFIQDLTSDRDSLAIVKTIINLAESMQIDLIAEGIETKEQFKVLKQLGCQSFQGFYFSKPAPADTLF